MTNARTARAERTARELKAAALRAEAARARARRRSLIVSVAVLAVLGLVIGGVFLVRNADQGTALVTPRNVTADGGVVLGDAGAKATVVIYEDFLCPACRNSHELNGTQLKQWLDAGTVRVEYRPIAILDAQSTDEYSSRALNVAAAVADTAPQAFPAFHDALFARQPAEGGPGLPDDTLVDLAVEAGAPRDAIRKAVEDGTYRRWADETTERSSKAGVSGTPTILVNGTKLESYDPALVAAAVQAATAK